MRLKNRMPAVGWMIAFGLCFASTSPTAAHGEVVRGIVFHDRDGDAARDPDEQGLADVGVSNGRDVVRTGPDGRYELPVDDDDIVFVIKPRNYMTPVDRNNVPRFCYVHKPAGSPKHLKYAGVAPTGPLPASVDFPLVSREEPDQFNVVVFGDPQTRNIREIDYLAHDVVDEVIGVDAAFGISLGDIMFDNLSLYGPYNAVMSAIGIPWHNIHGNHDMNYDVDDDEMADETWERVYGPPTYSFDWGPVHFIAIDGVMYEGQANRRRYHCEFGRHLTFVENDLKHVPDERLVVLLMHIPLVEATDLAKLFALLRNRPYTLSLAAHWHTHQQFFLDSSHGWPGPKPHHVVVAATACGSWWRGAPDERGIPHATMSDGGPNGHYIVRFSGHDYTIRFKAARRPADEQMSIHAPPRVRAGSTGGVEVLVNVYAGSERSIVQMRVGKSTPWRPMKAANRPDPFFTAIKASEKGKNPPNGRKLPKADKSTHLWSARLPENLAVGGHVIEVRTRDMFGQTWTARRVIEVEGRSRH
ncbi:MAG: calcineurin-like phosphoesterase family protein [Planctomycetota bacterium]|nr:calcineurin-like phosphoesterase family protein [Planctomycetota bacterium]